jgi:ribosomal protein S18 acetylase RimI-like enzyme
MWVGENDEVLIAHLESRGFERSPAYMLSMQRSLAEPIPEPRLPASWGVRPLGGEGEVQNRSSASHTAFRSSMPFKAYWQRYLRFMRSPAYAAALDLVAVSPKGRIAAFCVCWFDPANRVGLFEPVGTHPYYRQRGLGKAVILEGLKKMKAHGMATATVITEGDNQRAQRLYRSAGFVPANHLYTYKKPSRSGMPWQPKPSKR